jgi:hypothetical protein
MLYATHTFFKDEPVLFEQKKKKRSMDDTSMEKYFFIIAISITILDIIHRPAFYLKHCVVCVCWLYKPYWFMKSTQDKPRSVCVCVLCCVLFCVVLAL